MDTQESDLQTYDPDAGENAVLIQPGNYPGPTRPLGTGPTVEVNTLSYNTIPDARLPDHPVTPVWSLDAAMARADEYRSAHPFKPLEPALGTEFAICTHRVEEHPYISEEELFAEGLSVDRQEEMDKVLKSWEGTKIGGCPYWLQSEQLPFDDWLLLFQAAEEALPVAVNIGTGVMYCFVNKELTLGKMLWQC